MTAPLGAGLRKIARNCSDQGASLPLRVSSCVLGCELSQCARSAPFASETGVCSTHTLPPCDLATTSLGSADLVSFLAPVASASSAAVMRRPLIAHTLLMGPLYDWRRRGVNFGRPGGE